MKRIGFTHGRFGPLHNGHFQIFMYILDHYDSLIVGISNPLRELPTNLEDLDLELREALLKAREPENNPYSYAERKEMIEKSLRYGGIEPERFSIIPHFAFYDTRDWRDFMPPKEDCCIVLSPKDRYHYDKIQRYEAEGWRVETVPQFPGVFGKMFDEAWPDGNWRDLVPKGTVEVLERKLKTR